VKFAYKNRGASLLEWNGRTAPSQTRAGETRGLGSLGASAIEYGVRRSSVLRKALGDATVCCPRCPCSQDPCCSDRSASSPALVRYRYAAQRRAARPAIRKALGAYPLRKELGTLGGFNMDIPRPGAPEVVSGYMPEGAARGYGETSIGEDPAPAPTFDTGLIRKAAVLASAYHGVKRNNGSVWWGLVWALGAYVAPVSGVSAVGIAVAQGFGKPK